MPGRYAIVEDRTGATGYSPRGAALALWRSKRPEVIISGPAETGKTYACLQKLDALLWKYPGAQAVLLRKSYHSLTPSALQTLLRKVYLDGSPVVAFGGERPEWMQYPNGSRLYVAGLDKASKVLSSDRDFMYVNQAEELSLADWETLTTRVTGRAGNAPYAQLIGDCNPGPEHHWIKTRPQLQPLLESRHEDNPTLFGADGQITDRGRRTLAFLDALTGVRKERLRYGRWVSAEGAVYAFDARDHVVDWFAIPPSWPRFRSVDFGFTNPFVCLWGALDPDGRLYIYREWYRTGQTVRFHAVKIKQLSEGERIEATVADSAAAEDRATLAECGIATLPSDKPIALGIQAVATRLAKAADGRPRLFLLRGALVERDETLAEQRKPLCCAEEFDSYVWPKAADGRPIKETPVDLHNHSLDALRYLVMHLDARERTGGATMQSGGRSQASQPPRGERAVGDIRRPPRGV